MTLIMAVIALRALVHWLTTRNKMMGNEFHFLMISCVIAGLGNSVIGCSLCENSKSLLSITIIFP